MGDPSSFTSPPVQDVIKLLCSASDHVPSQALPISPVELRIICDYLDNTTTFTAAIKPAILLSFACMLRASNITSPSTSVWGGAHTLKRSDINLTREGMSVAIYSTKTTRGPTPTILNIASIPRSSVCPHQAWIHYLVKVQPPIAGPAFIDDDRRPLTASPIVYAIRAALSRAGYQDSNRYSIHSLRRGSAQLAAVMGATDAELMCHGIWRSRSGLSHYTRLPSNKVSRSLAQGLAN